MERGREGGREGEREGGREGGREDILSASFCNRVAHCDSSSPEAFILFMN